MRFKRFITEKLETRNITSILKKADIPKSSASTSSFRGTVTRKDETDGYKIDTTAAHIELSFVGDGQDAAEAVLKQAGIKFKSLDNLIIIGKNQ